MPPIGGKCLLLLLTLANTEHSAIDKTQNHPAIAIHSHTPGHRSTWKISPPDLIAAIEVDCDNFRFVSNHHSVLCHCNGNTPRTAILPQWFFGGLECPPGLRYMPRNFFIRNTSTQSTLIERRIAKQLIIIYPDYMPPTVRSMQQLLRHCVVVNRNIRSSVEWFSACDNSVTYKKKLPTTRTGRFRIGQRCRIIKTPSITNIIDRR